MSHKWHRGVLDKSSWHGLEEVGVFANAEAHIAHGRRSGAWYMDVELVPLFTGDGVRAPGKGVLARYEAHPTACLATVGDRFRPTSAGGLDTLVRAAWAAGGKGTAAYALQGGTRQLATFEVGISNGLRTYLLVADACDGSLKLSCGFTSIRVVCANTLAMAFRQDGDGMAELRHTASLETNINVLAESIGAAVASGDKVRDTYERAESLSLDRDQASAIFDRLFPAADEDADEAAVTRAEGERADARRAMLRAENNAGGSLATLWNAATWLVDREANGDTRKCRGDALNSLLFGSRAKRVQEVQTIVEVILRDGTVREVAAGEALALGADPKQIGRAVLDEMLADL